MYALSTLYNKAPGGCCFACHVITVFHRHSLYVRVCHTWRFAGAGFRRAYWTTKQVKPDD